MASEWREIPIGSICEGIYDGPHATPTRTNAGPIFLGISSLVNGRLDLSQSDHLSEEDFPRWTRRIVPAKDDLVFSYETRLGEAALIPDGLRCCLGRRMALMRLDRRRADPRFILYAFLSPQFQEVIRSRTKQGSTVTRILLTEFGDFPILVPPMTEQVTIGEILGSLDERIDLLSQSNQCLEALARSIFKSWFVDFDPVRAKAEGREPEGMDATTAALCPDSFGESALGRIPKGWRIAPLAAVCDYIMSGGTPSTQNPEYWTGDIPWLSSGETRQRFITNTEKTISEEGVKKSSTRRARAGSTVIAGAGQGHTRGQASLLMFDSYINQSVIALAGEPHSLSDFFLFWNLEMRYDQFRQISDSQSSRGSLTGKLLSELRIVVPPRNLISAFDELTAPLVYRIGEGLRQSAILSELRDTLLPRLISGKLRVPEAEKLVEAVL
jgi:type I restriction enzyme S subunit